MEILSYLCFIFTVLYFVSHKRKVNVFQLAFIFTTLYFIPVFSGYSVDWVLVFSSNARAVPSLGDFKDTSLELYITYFLLCSLYIFSDKLFHAYIPVSAYKKLTIMTSDELNGYKYTSKASFILTIIFLLYLGLTGSLMKYDAVANGAGLLQAFYLSFVIITAVVSMFIGKPKYVALTVVVLIISLGSGSRTPIAIFIMAYFVLKISEYDLAFFSIIRKKFPVVLLALFGVVFIILSKYIYTFHNLYGAGFFVPLYDYLAGGTACYHCAFEPAIQLSFYDMVVENRNLLSAQTNYLKSFLSLLPFPTSWFDYSGSAFSTDIHQQLLPNAGYSIAGNVFAEAYLYGGMIGVMIFMLLYVSLLSFLNYKLFYSSGTGIWRPLYLILTIYIVFFIHRYALGSLFGHIRNIFYPFFIILITYSFLKGVTFGKK